MFFFENFLAPIANLMFIICLIWFFVRYSISSTRTPKRFLPLLMAIFFLSIGMSGTFGWMLTVKFEYLQLERFARSNENNFSLKDFIRHPQWDRVLAATSNSNRPTLYFDNCNSEFDGERIRILQPVDRNLKSNIVRLVFFDRGVIVAKRDYLDTDVGLFAEWRYDACYSDIVVKLDRNGILILTGGS